MSSDSRKFVYACQNKTVTIWEKKQRKQKSCKKNILLSGLSLHFNKFSYDKKNDKMPLIFKILIEEAKLVDICDIKNK